jgi:hypothetical protein
VDPGVAGELASRIEAELVGPTQRLPMRYYALEQEPRGSGLSSVRRLTTKDAPAVERSDPLFRPFFLGRGSARRTLSEGVVAGLVAEGQLTTAATTSAWAGLHVDLGAATLGPERGRGLATGAAFAVCSELRARGLVPPWAAGEANPASWHVAEALGFRYTGRREYVVVEELRPAGFRPRKPDRS